jgi:hypothetical protein
MTSEPSDAVAVLTIGHRNQPRCPNDRDADRSVST